MALGIGQVISWYICTVVAFCFLACRLIIRWRKFGKLGVDDCFIILAALCLVGDLIIQQYMWNQGMASIATASRENFIHIMQMIVPGSTLYVSSLWAIKIALVIYYKQLASRTSMQIVYNITLGFLVASWTAIFLDIIFECFPIDRKWSTDPSRTCSKKSSDINYWITILLNICTDIVIISLPISMVLKLKMPLKQRLGVAGIFALGFFVVIASIVRAYYSKRNETMLTCTVSMVETAVAIIATCLPALRVLILGHMSSKTGTSSYGRQRYELSSRRQENSKGPEVYTSRLGGTRNRHDSEDELVKEGASVSSVCATADEGHISPQGITIETEFQIYEEAGGGQRVPRSCSDIR